MIMVYITGDVIQPNCTRKTGPRWCHTLEDDNEMTRRRAEDRIGDLIRDYERREGQCSSFEIKVVK